MATHVAHDMAIRGNQHSQHPKEHKKQTEIRIQVS